MDGDFVFFGDVDVAVHLADVDVDEDKVLGEEIVVGALAEVIVEDLTVAAPVAAEVEDDALVLFAGLSDGGRDIGFWIGGPGVDMPVERRHRGRLRERWSCRAFRGVVLFAACCEGCGGEQKSERGALQVPGAEGPGCCGDASHGDDFIPDSGALFASVVAVASLHDVVLLLVVVAELEINLVVALRGGVLVRGEGETVLGAELGGDLGVDVGGGLLFGDLEETSAGLVGHAIEDLLAVNLAATLAAGAVATAASTGIASATTAGVAATGESSGEAYASALTATSAAAGGVVAGLALLAFEVDGVDDGVGALGGFDGLGEGLTAGVVDAVGEDDEGLATLLLAHELVSGEEDGVVEGGATAAVGAVLGAAVAAAVSAAVAAVSIASVPVAAISIAIVIAVVVCVVG